MKRFCSNWLAAVALAMVVAPAVALAQRTGPEHARLTVMAGTWDAEMTLWPRPGGPGIPAKATSTIRPLFDGRFIEEKIDGTLNGTPFTTLAWTRISSTNLARVAESGTFDDTAKQFELKADYTLAGDVWHQRTVIQAVSDTAMTATSYLSFGTVPEWKAVEIKYTRKTR